MKRRTSIIVLVAAIASLALIVVKYPKAPPQNTTELTASVRLNWIPSCSFSGEVLGSRDFASSNGISLKLEAGGPGLDPIKLVQSGANTFGVAGADLVLVANDKGADLAVIGLVSYDSPGVWLSKKAKNIRTIADVRGKRIGELPGGNMQYLYEVFLRKAGLKRVQDFTPVPISFDLKPFISQDDCDLRPVFIYDEPSDLTLQGIDYNIIEPKQFGISFKGICYFCTQETVTRHPELVKRFIFTMAQGWRKALANPEEAISALKAFDSSINERKELIGLKAGIPYFAGFRGKVLTTDTESWKEMSEVMRELGFLKGSPDLNRTLQLQFVQSFHNTQ